MLKQAENNTLSQWLCRISIAIASFLLTLLRHELLHVAGIIIVGGQVSAVNWFPRLGVLATIDSIPPLQMNRVSYYFPLCLPYVIDLLLILLSPWIYHLRIYSQTQKILFEHVLYFAALDIMMNSLGAFIGRNDWTLILEPLGHMKYLMLLLLVFLTPALVIWRNKFIEVNKASFMISEPIVNTYTFKY